MDFFQRLPGDVHQRILNLLDLPEINRLRVLDRGSNSLISDYQFLSQYNKHRISRLWMFSHVCEPGDDIGAMMGYRVDEDEREMELHLPLDIPPIIVGDSLRLFNMCGSLFLFSRHTPNPDDEDDTLVSLCVVNPFTRLIRPVELPDGLVFDVTGSVRLSIEHLDNIQQQHFTVSYLYLNGNQVPTFSEYHSTTNLWEPLLLEAAPLPENHQLDTHDPRAFIHTLEEITYLVSFLDGQLVFQTVPTNILIGNTFQGLPVPQPPDGRIMVELQVVRGPWAFMLFCHSPEHLPHLSSIAAVALAKIKPNWTGFDLLPVIHINSSNDDLFYIRLDAGIRVHQTGRHVNIGMVTSDLGLVLSIRTFSYDLHSREWRDFSAVYDEDVDVIAPFCSNMLTL